MLLDYNKDEGSDDGKNDEELLTRLIVMRMTTVIRKMTRSVEMRKMTVLVQVTEREAAAVAEWESSSTGLHSMRFKRKSERNSFTEFFSFSCHIFKI